MIIKGSSLTRTEFKGLEIFDYTAGLKTDSSFAIVMVPPGGTHPLSFSKRSDKTCYVISGTVVVTIGGDENQLFRGDACLVFKNQEYTYTNPADETAILALVHTPRFDPEAEVILPPPPIDPATQIPF